MGIISTILYLIAAGVGFYIFAAMCIFFICVFIFWKVWKTMKKSIDEINR